MRFTYICITISPGDIFPQPMAISDFIGNGVFINTMNENLLCLGYVLYFAHEIYLYLFR